MSSDLGLHDIADTYSVSWWPLAWGWWVLIALLIVLLGGVCFWLIQRARQRRGMRLLRAQLKHPLPSLSAVNLTLKQAALLYYPRQQIAALHSEQWQAFLLEQLPPHKQAAFAPRFNQFQAVQYQPHDAATVAAYQQLIADWASAAWPPKHRQGAA
ncbi:DUF4381 domain-containing protein [Aliidiomarina sedimenti]|uniref:DUF4381 domain-containing protein n=1 Tax=Aliidiomarina sedimenti TaxID=1933879 RepID=A0ABY0C354_9GAMM|nr:DUF4381 domain-containing protein [Aliidiomarina sedimenti]RUO32195.1 DUF4381 domain-containing protein [Aliidiomarina sedimenti]